MAVTEDSLQGRLGPRFLDELGDVELRDDIFIDCSFRADDIDIHIGPCYAEFSGLEARPVVPGFELLDLVLQVPLIVLRR